MTKPEIAIREIDRVIACGVRFGCVLADSGYGSSGTFRQALSERGLKWAVGLSRRQNVYRGRRRSDLPRREGRKASQNTPFRISLQSPPKSCWLEHNGEGSTGGGEPRVD